MIRFNFLAVLLMLTLFLSCEKEPINLADYTISEAERQILNNCSADALTDSMAIANNLIGDWALVGYACSGCAPGPEIGAALTFTDSSGVASYQSGESFSESFGFTWKLVPYLYDTDTIYVLESDPLRSYIYIPNFCEQYMYRNDLAGDGAMYLYEKQ